MTTLAVLSLKGGVGKTSVVLGLAEAARGRGGQVLVIDLDPQANATETLLAQQPDFSSNDVLSDGRRGVARDAVITSTWGEGLAVIGADPALEHRNRDQSRNSGGRLRNALRGVDSGYDLVLIDCPPSIGELTRNALIAANSALIVTEPGYYALRGAQQALDSISLIAGAANPRLRCDGIVVNRFRSVLKEHRHRVEELREVYPHLVLDPLLPERSVVANAHGRGSPVQQQRGKAAREMASHYERLLDHVVAAHPPSDADDAAPGPTP